MTRHEVVFTSSGVRVMHDHETGETMHPTVGPLIEAERLYLTPSRLPERLSTRALVLLDAGLGAGSNAIAAWRCARDLGHAARPLEIVSIDITLAPFELALQTEHAAAFGFDEDAAAAGSVLLATGLHESAHARWRLRVGDLASELLQEPASSVDIVFWDAYSSRTDATLWNVQTFTALRRLCRAGATVHTYSAATTTRTALLLAGFAVGYGVAAGGKQKHSTVAAVDLSDIERPLDARWLETACRSPANWPSDAPPDARARLEALPQFTRG